MSVAVELNRELRVFVPGPLWTVNAERSMVHWEHRKRTDQIRKAAAAAFYGLPPFTVPVVVSAWPRTLSGKADVGAHYPATKGAIDGAVDAGVLPDDTPEWVRVIVQYPPRKVPMKDQGILLVLRPIPTEE